MLMNLKHRKTQKLTEIKKINCNTHISPHSSLQCWQVYLDLITLSTSTLKKKMHQGQQLASISAIIIMTRVVDFSILSDICFSNNYALIVKWRQNDIISYQSNPGLKIFHTSLILFIIMCLSSWGWFKRDFLQPYRAGMKMKIGKN